MMRIIRYIRNYFRVRKVMESLKDQASRVQYLDYYVDKNDLFHQLNYCSNQLYKIDKRSGSLEMDLEMVPIYLKGSRQFRKAPKVYVRFELTCCLNMKMIIFPWKRDSEKYKFSIIKGVNSDYQGEGSFDSCIKEIKEYLKNG